MLGLRTELYYFQQKEQERIDFLTKLRGIRSEMRHEKFKFNVVARSSAKEVKKIRREMEKVENTERLLAERFFAKRDRQRGEREAVRINKEARMKAVAYSSLDEPSEQQLALFQRRDEALFILDADIREAELNEIANLEVEYEEQRRIGVERRILEIEKELDKEELDNRKMDDVEEDLLMSDVREQLSNYRDQITNEQNIFDANRVCTILDIYDLITLFFKYINRMLSMSEWMFSRLKNQKW